MGKAQGHLRIDTYPLDITFTCVRKRFVKADGSGYADATDPSFGVSLNPGVSGDTQDMAIGGYPVVEAGGTIAVGDDLMTDSNGKVVKAAALTVAAGATPVTSSGANGAILAGTTLPKYLRGRALNAGASGDDIIVKMI